MNTNKLLSPVKFFKVSRLSRYLGFGSLFCLSPTFADILSLEKGSYTDSLHNRVDIMSGKPFTALNAAPKVSSQLSSPYPTTDWWSSLIWSFNNQNMFSEAMFPHPLSVKTNAKGLEIGYPQEARVYSHEWQGKILQRNSGYQYPHFADMTVGLDGFNVDKTVVDAYSDWTVTSLWQQGQNELRATFGHGLSFTYFEKKGNKDAVIEFAELKQNHHFSPFNAQVFTLDHINGQYLGSATEFAIFINANAPGLAVKARISYDFNGDGEYDKVELYSNFATDADEQSIERYTQNDRGGLDQDRSYGQYQHFNNGKVRVEIWQTEGQGSLLLDLTQTNVKLPFQLEAQSYYLDASNHRLTAHMPAVNTVNIGSSNEPRAAGDIAKVWYQSNNTVGVTINNHHYGIFAPHGSQWQRLQHGNNDWVYGLRSNLSGKDYFSVAVLPDNTPETLSFYQKHAFAFVRDTQVSFEYQKEQSRVLSTFNLQTELKESHPDYINTPLAALYRHQWLNSNDELSAYSYQSARGEMRVVANNHFNTSMRFHGVLPILPKFDDSTLLRQKFMADFQRLQANPTLFSAKDTYWRGKEYAKVADLIQVADQLGLSIERDYLLSHLKSDIAAWLTVDANNDQAFYYYEPIWGTLIGYPASFGSNDQLNDHHFHYGYLVKAAAVIALYDSAWATDYKDMINLVIKDVANIERNDMRFPWLRQYDLYAGHAWASGHASFASGNNQESSSESMHFSSAVILWAEATQQDNLRDLGVLLYSLENQAINQYWFDVDNAVFPSDFSHSNNAIVWSDGGVYGTWWTANPEEIHGINFLPIHGGSLYLGQYPQYVAKNIADLNASNAFFEAANGNNNLQWNNWQGILLQYMALQDAQGAMTAYQNMQYTPEYGTTDTLVYHWLHNLTLRGQVVKDIYANTPSYAVFNNNGQYSYVAFNADTVAKEVRFSDGVSFVVNPRSFALLDNGVVKHTPLSAQENSTEDPHDNTNTNNNTNAETNNTSEDTADNNSSTNNSNNSNDSNNSDQNNQSGDNNNEQSSTTENNSQDTTTSNDVVLAITDPEGRFDGVLRVNDNVVTVEINSEVTRNYIILHFIDHNGVQQNVQLILNSMINGKSQWTYSTQYFDLNKPFKFTLQDSKFGQFESIAYLAANLAINTDNTAANNSNNTSDSNTSNDPNNTNEEAKVNSNSILLSDPEGRFSAKMTRNNDKLQLAFDAKQQRHYVIFHYMDQQGLKQNVHLLPTDGYQWTWQGNNIDLMKPVQFTVHDMHVGQFSSSEYSLAALQVGSVTETETTESASDSSNNSNHNDDQRIEVNEERFSLSAVINQSNGAFNITLNAKQERAYVIIHYVDKQGIPQNRHLIRQENNQWQLDADSFDQNKGFSLTIDDPRGQFSTERYFF
ncbi:glycosyl hydrolase [Cysteiniphilum sp. JM-1]|uniref:glycosyl hydrolase n=1 Tax=Cysteiniphilum sp. JM-1 TaxID=2610891 RepID=UPI0012468D55|nr:glycosyl hydrolase [Cysteiniphilum sp. JM-1]